MGDQHQGHLSAPGGAHDEIENELRVHAVEITGGFIRKEHGRAIGKASSYGDALPFSAGELGREMVEPMLQPDGLEQLRWRDPSLSDRGRFVSNIGICTFSNDVKVGSR